MQSGARVWKYVGFLAAAQVKFESSAFFSRLVQLVLLPVAITVKMV